MKNKYKLLILSSLMALGGMFTGCSKKEDNKESLNSLSSVTLSEEELSEEIVDSIKVDSAPKENLRGTTLNLDDYVTTYCSGKEGGTYYAASLTPDTAEIEKDGKTLKFINTGNFLIEIKDASGTKVAYFSGIVTSNESKRIKEFAGNIKNNYTIYSYDVTSDDITTYFPAYHTKDYYAYPSGFYYGNYEDKNSVYKGILKFSNDEVYEYTSGYTEDTLEPDTSTITLGSYLRGDTENYLGFSDFDASCLSSFTSADDSSGHEYIVGNMTSEIGNALFYQTIGVYVGKSYCDKVALQINPFEGKDALYVSCIKENKVINQYVITDIGTTKYVPLESYIKDLSNCREKIDVTPICDVIKNIVQSENYTATSRTYLADDTYGTEYDITEAVKLYTPFFCMYSEGTSRFTDEGMFISVKTPSEADLSKYSEETKYAYIERMDGVYEAVYSAENDYYVLGDEKKKDDKSSYSRYQDYFSTLENVNTETLSDFVIMNYYESTKTYSFSIKKDSVSGSDNLRALTNFINPTISAMMFPESTGDNDFEAGYAGEGLITLNDDGGFTFYYYTSRVSENAYGQNIYFRICMEYTLTNVENTSIDEFTGI